MTRLVVLAYLVLGVGVSRAEGMLGDNTSNLKFNKLLLHEDNNPEAEQPKVDPDSINHYFNFAHCVCSQFNPFNDPQNPPQNPDFHENTFEWEITVENNTAPIDRPVEVWVGTDCGTNDTPTREANCTKAGMTGTITSIVESNGVRVPIDVFKLMTPKMTDRLMGCQERKLSATTWLLVDNQPDGDFDYKLAAAIETDAEPPPLPTEFSAQGAENAINISWKAPSDPSDVFAYQALCATSTGSPAKTDPPEALYMTPNRLCGAQQNLTLTASPISTSSADPDAGTASVDITALSSLDPMFICGEVRNSTANGMRIEGLQNGVAYTVVLLAIDKYQNARGTYFTQSLTPVPSTDFWEDLQNQGSGVEGGFCLLSQTYGDSNPLTNALRSFRDNTLGDTAFGRWLVDVYYGTLGAIDLHGILALRIVAGVVLLPLVAVALLWHLLTLPGLLALIVLGVLVRKHRIGRPKLAMAATAAGVLLLPFRAHAQTPYWDDPAVESNDISPLAIGDPERVTWHVGVRLGPYIPGIDAQLGMPRGGADGPYEQMFGGSSILPMLDIDRIFFRSFGQLGLGVSLGYMGKKAHPWQVDSSPDDPNRPRATGDDNKFRLFPFSLNAVYRFTYLDDEYGIPIVPYARGGLAYYVWWVTAPDGDFAKACVGGGDAPMCETTSARGASLGLVGSVGVAIRAERIDEAAARSMRESGIEHAGFYAEYSVGWVDGFGSDKKLSVGDATWFAGVDFEF